MKTIIAAYSQNQSGSRSLLREALRPLLALVSLPRWPSRGDLRAWVQLLAVAQWMLSFLLMGLLLLLLLVYLAFTPFWPVSALYLAWLLLDWETPERGGRSSSWVRSWPIWSYFRDYFPIQLVKTHPLSPGHNYMVGVHPHGLLCVGAFANFVTGATGFAEKFPGIRPALGTLAGNFRLPGIREYLMSGGLFPVTPRAIAHLLSRSGTGNAVVLVVGGAAESLSASRPGETTLVLRRRKGFVRLALQHGAHLVPAFSFGEEALFRQVCFAEGGWARSLQDRCRRALGFAPCLFHGRGLLPLPFPVATVVSLRCRSSGEAPAGAQDGAASAGDGGPLPRPVRGGSARALRGAQGALRPPRGARPPHPLTPPGPHSSPRKLRGGPGPFREHPSIGQKESKQSAFRTRACVPRTAPVHQVLCILLLKLLCNKTLSSALIHS
ncbi:diacylglycerol O-acyltransferase 2 isoform X2 [Anolis carolinensis]|uniref:diacylglycerol O-acyltransferase 2 isoform X2 n=1 Tax=Anolis carolinensis TaxID=28377 RepID=UPI002F2B4FE7